MNAARAEPARRRAAERTANECMVGVIELNESKDSSWDVGWGMRDTGIMQIPQYFDGEVERERKEFSEE